MGYLDINCPECQEEMRLEGSIYICDKCQTYTPYDELPEKEVSHD